MIQALQMPLVPINRTETFFGLLYGTHMQPFPRRRIRDRLSQRKKHDQERQWVFLGSKENMKSVATQSSLYAMLNDPNVDTTYYTPNGYYRRDQRLTETLRWLNAYVFDLDTTDETLADVFERIEQAGLPFPTAVIRTPSGGFHICYFFSQSVRATPKALRLYTAIMEHMASDLGADRYAVGANRIFRTPSDDNLVYFNPENRYGFDFFVDWREINHPMKASFEKIWVKTDDVMNSAAMQLLLNRHCPAGQRDRTCFTLALGMFASGWSIEEAKQAITKWHKNCCESGGKEPFTLRDAIYKITYVYRKENLHAPSAEVVRELSGLSFSYTRRAFRQSAKPRNERSRSHISEWKADLVELLKQEPMLSGSQAELAAKINCPLSSFKIILKQLESEGIISVESKRGRGGLTTIHYLVQNSSQNDTTIMEFDLKIAKNAKYENVLYIDFSCKQRKKNRSSRVDTDLSDPSG